MKSEIAKIVALIIVLILSVNTIVLAASQSDLNSTQKKINEAKEELHGIQEEKSSTMAEVETITNEISQYQTEIDELNTKIDDLEGQISEAQENLDKAQEDYTNQEKLLKERLIATYEAGETSYLDVILSSKNLTDFISNYYLVTQIANNDKALMDKIVEQKKEIEDSKQKLENSKNELDTSKSSKKDKQKQLSIAKEEKDEKVAELSEDEKQTQAELDQYEADKREIQAQLAALAKRQRASGGNPSIYTSNPSAAGFIFPVAGLSKANINNKNYPSYSGHTGVDVNIGAAGQTVVAAKAGTVITSMAKKNSAGNYVSYGEYIIIDHGDGLATLYGHGLAGSRRVSAGQTVSQGQAIMTVGSTGNSSGPHLHFEVRVNGNPVNPLPYLP